MRIRRETSLLLVIDLQGRLLPAIEGGDTVLANATWLADIAQTLGVPVIATEHCPHSIGFTEPALRSRFQDDLILEKEHFSAVSEGRLLTLAHAERPQWVVVGTEAHVCVQQTVLDLLASGREVYVVDDAVGSRRARDKELALARMQQNGAEIVSREMVAFEWLGKANTEVFRDVLKRFIR